MLIPDCRSRLARLLLALAFLVPAAHSQPIAPGAYDNTTAGFGAWYFGGGARIGTTGYNMSTMPTVPANPTNAAGYLVKNPMGIYVPATGPTIAGQSTFDIPGSGGRTAPVTVTAPLNKPTLGSAFAKLGKALPVISTGIALFDFAKELGWILAKNADGSVDYKQENTTNNCADVAPYTTSPPAPNSAYTGAGWTYQYTWILTGASSCQFGYRYINSSYSWSLPPSGYWVGHHAGTWSQGAYQIQKTESDFINDISAKSGWPQTTSAQQNGPKAIQQTLDNQIPLAIDPPSVTGPASVSGPTSTTTAGTSTIVSSTTWNLTYNGDTITITTNNTTNNNGSTSTQTVSGTTQQEPGCGLPGSPPCKMDESGTPSTKDLKLDEATINTQANTNKSTIGGSSDKGMFSSWSALFVTPPVVSCTPLTMPSRVSSVVVDPCPVVEGVRSIMAWMWALVGFWVALGWVREVT